MLDSTAQPGAGILTRGQVAMMLRMGIVAYMVALTIFHYEASLTMMMMVGQERFQQEYQ